MNPSSGIFGQSSSFEERYIPDYTILEQRINGCRNLGYTIVLTNGTFDLTHIGHARYLEKARSFGDVLIVGVDSDEKVRQRKGPDRPLVPEMERLESLVHLRYPNIVTLKKSNAPRWELIKIVRPDVLVATKETYNSEDLNGLREYCKRIEVLEPMATTSTSNKIRLMQIVGLLQVSKKILEMLPEEQRAQLIAQYQKMEINEK